MIKKTFLLALPLIAILTIQSIGAESEPRIDPLVIAQLSKNTEVEVIVVLKDTSPVDYDRKLSKQRNYEIYWEKARYFETDQERVLSKLLPKEFNLKYKYHVINGFSGSITKQGLEKLKQDPIVRAVTPNRKVRAGLEESLPLINAPEVWSDYNITGEGQTIAILDTGIDYTHPDLGGCSEAEFLAGNCAKVPGGHDFVNNDNNPMDDHGHGTHVAGIAAADGDIVGVAPGANLVAVKVLDENNAFGNADDVIMGINWCVENMDNFNISVINMSLGTWQLYANHCDLDQPGLSGAINAATAVGIFVVACSMNDGSFVSIAAPACIENATSVGATYDADVGDNVVWWPPPGEFVCIDETTEPDQIVCFTNRCAILELLAPGAIITSTALDGGETNMAGTSMAAPHVAGAAALLLESNIYLMPDQIEDILEETGVLINDPETELDFPRIDVYKAVDSLYNFCVKNSLDEPVAWFDSFGNLFLKGALTTEVDPLEENPAHDEFRVQDSEGNDVAIIDTTDGNMYIVGEKHEDVVMSGQSPEGFIIKNSNGDVVAYIDDSGPDTELGHLYLAGKLYENSE